ncbi:hypothetical protein ACFLXY_11495 [Chloroflexota bacterium]
MENTFVGFIAVLQGLGIFLVLPIIIASIIISLVMIAERIKQNMTGSIKESIENLVCSIDTDCPEGYLCIGGKCIPQIY